MNSIRCGLLAAAALCVMISPAPAEELPLWQLYENTFKSAKYIDLTHPFEPVQPVWPGFGPARFKPAVAGHDLGDFAKAGEAFTYEKHGFVATAYELTTDQYGTQLDPPAHWDELGAPISDIPASVALRPLVVVDVHDRKSTRLHSSHYCASRMPAPTRIHPS